MSEKTNLYTAQSKVSTHHACKFMRVVPDVTPMSSLSDLTKFLVYSFQESDHRLVADILENRERGLKEEMQKSKEILEKELKEEKKRVENLMNSQISFEEKVKKDCILIEEGDLKQKNLEAMVKHLREELEKELKRVRDLIKKLSLVSMERRKLQEENKRQRKMQNSLKEKLEKLNEYHKKNELESGENYRELKLERNLLKNELAAAFFEKKKLEDEMRRQRDIYKNKVDSLQERLKVQLDINRNLRKKFSLASIEKLELDESLRKTLILEDDLRKSRMDLEERIEVLEGGNLELNKKLELYAEKFCKMKDFAGQIIGVCCSSNTENVRAKGGLTNSSNAEDVSMFYSREKAFNVEGRLSESQISSREPPSKSPLQKESEGQIDILLGEKSGCLSIKNKLEDGGYCENNDKQNLKRRRTTRAVVD